MTHFNTSINNGLAILNEKLQMGELLSEGERCGTDATTDIDYQRIGRERFPVIAYSAVSLCMYKPIMKNSHRP